MAIDTQNKRRSAQLGAAGTMRPVADGTIGAADRAQAAWFYSGLNYTVVISTLVSRLRSLGFGFGVWR